MSRAFGTCREGRIVLDASVDWPEGARVAVEAADLASCPAEDDRLDGPEARAALMARLDAIGPPGLSPEDESEIAAARGAARRAGLRTVRRRMGLAP
jgi:hypothetical protein